MDTTEKLMQSLVDMMGENPTDPEGLIPVLREQYEDGDDHELGWAMLRSPFVYQIPFHSWKMANEQHRVKEAEFDRLVEGQKFVRAIWLLERPYRLSKLLEWSHDASIPVRAVKDLIGDVWKDVEHPHQFDEDELVDLFRLAGWVDDHESNRTLMKDRLRTAAGALTVYRGVGKEGNPKGMAWTLSRKTAEWFARRFGGKDVDGWVYTARIPSFGILAYLTGRGEDEVVVDPSMLEDVTVVPVFPEDADE